jgi:hypothetical protein
MFLFLKGRIYTKVVRELKHRIETGFLFLKGRIDPD